MSRYAPLAAVATCALLALTACSKPKPAEGQAKFDSSLSMAELMGHVIDPASFGYWKGSGTEVTDKGERDLSPTSDEGWEALESSAAVLIEAGNMLQLPGRARAPEAHWNAYAQQLTRQAVAAKAAALKHDKTAVFVEGGKLYEVCTACHKEYVIDPQLKANGPAEGSPLPAIPKDFQPKS